MLKILVATRTLSLVFVILFLYKVVLTLLLLAVLLFLQRFRDFCVIAFKTLGNLVVALLIQLLLALHVEMGIAYLL